MDLRVTFRAAALEFLPVNLAPRLASILAFRSESKQGTPRLVSTCSGGSTFDFTCAHVCQSLRMPSIIAGCIHDKDSRATGVLKAVPASQEDLHLRAHSRCKRRLMDSASAALVLSSDEAPHQVACIMLVLIDSFTLRPLVTSSTSSMCVAVASK